MLNNNVYNLGYATGLTLHRFLLKVEQVWNNYDIHHPLTMTTMSLSSDLSLESLLYSIGNAPSAYKEWWMKLLQEDPTHVIIETMLILFVVYLMLFNNGKRYKKGKKSSGSGGSSAAEEELTEGEKEELLSEWKHKNREGLVPPRQQWDNSSNSRNNQNKYSDGFVVEQVTGPNLIVTYTDYEKNSKKKKSVLNFATHDFLGMSSSNNQQNKELSSLKQQSIEALNTYGCGSCGPRGFYGTIDAHLQLEQAMASFLKTDSAILYSDAASASTSAVAAFAKRGDLLIVDEAIYEPLRTGVTLSRATVKYFRHNDMEDLRRVLQHQQDMDVKLKRSSSDRRKFIVVEGLYKHSGTMAPLDEISKLKSEFCYRLIVDESFSFGTVGCTGRGALEYYGLRPMYDAEVIIVGLEQALGSIGGICVGTEEVVDHQRLSGAGYCFSASAPPFIAKAALASLQCLQQKQQQNQEEGTDDNNGEEKPSKLLEKLNENRKYMYELLSSQQSTMKEVIPDKLVVTSQDISPLVFLQLSPFVLQNYRDDDIKTEANINEGTKSENTTMITSSSPSSPTQNKTKNNNRTNKADTTSKPTKKSTTILSREEQTKLLDKIAYKCLEKGVAIISTGKSVSMMEDMETNSHFVTPAPSLKLVVNAVQSREHLEKCVGVLKEVVLEVL